MAPPWHRDLYDLESIEELQDGVILIIGHLQRGQSRQRGQGLGVFFVFETEKTKTKKKKKREAIGLFLVLVSIFIGVDILLKMCVFLGVFFGNLA